jgi:hypothetical protein
MVELTTVKPDQPYKIPFVAEFCAPKRFMKILFYTIYFDYNKPNNTGTPVPWYVGYVLESECPTSVVHMDQYPAGEKAYFELKDFYCTPTRHWMIAEITEEEQTALLMGLIC